MADAAASKAVVGNHMRVQLPPSAFISYGCPCVSFKLAILKMEFWFK